MKKRIFFLTSLLLALMALGAQIIGWFGLAATNAASLMMMFRLPPFTFIRPGENQPQPSDGDVFRVMIWGGLALAVLSVSSVAVSFRHRESGWRFIPVNLLGLYAGTWVVIGLG